jgi:hypothetical protein
MLTSQETSFLRSHALTAKDVYDGRGEATHDRSENARAAGKSIVLATACMRGHRLRTLHGHCVQCDPGKLAAESRLPTAGYVFIAGSLSKEMIRIGFAPQIDKRKKLLPDAYDGASDWQLLYSAKVDDGVRIEDTDRRRLKAFRVPAEFIKDGAVQGVELLQTTFSRALKAVSEAIGSGRCDKPWRSPHWSKYNFGK